MDLSLQRPRVKGKFLYIGNEKLWIRGVTYGTFRPDQDGNEYPKPEIVEQDFLQIVKNNINAIRTYTVPPQWFLDAAQRHGLRIMIGLPWEQHITFLSQKKLARDIEKRVRAGVRVCAAHPAILCYAVGNEIPAAIVRWHGHKRIERFIKRLYETVKVEDPDGLFTYVNYPSTEYLHLPFIDIVGFNVYLESQERFESYLGRLHNIAGDRPLFMTEIGLDSRRHGEEAQADTLDWQVRTTFAAGCSGAFVFAWTDEWHRGGYDIKDWDFGVTTRDRRSKPALAAIRKAFAEIPFPKEFSWPRVSVIVCSFNGARTIRDCFESIQKLDYPNYEVIVVSDGSTDSTASITQEYDFRLICTKNLGLSSARNTGLEAATGEIVAYIDDDAYPDPHWLTYLVVAIEKSKYKAIGGPNIAPSGDGIFADCIANAPGGPIHVLLSDHEAEHIPGCNMAFRKSALEAVKFDPQFRIAGDDVDLCWRFQEKGWTLGFSPAAVVYHHRRKSVLSYFKQQLNYGKAEALLEKKWPEKYDGVGHLRWTGRIYKRVLTKYLTVRRKRVYHGIWGSAPFQSLYEPFPNVLSSLILMPEWYLLIAILTCLSILGTVWRPMIFVLPLLGFAIGASLTQAVLRARHATFPNASRSRLKRLGMHGLTALLHLVQPFARLWGRLSYGLTPWRRNGAVSLLRVWPRTTKIWSEKWQSTEERLRSLIATLRADRGIIRLGGDYDRWDLEVGNRLFGTVRIRMVIEEHGAGKQLLRFRTCPKCSWIGIILTIILSSLSMWAAYDQAWPACFILGAATGLLVLWILKESANAMHYVICALQPEKWET
jgi:glycosyltransferase involved in cell wall biosynthesis